MRHRAGRPCPRPPEGARVEKQGPQPAVERASSGLAHMAPPPTARPRERASLLQGAPTSHNKPPESQNTEHHLLITLVLSSLCSGWAALTPRLNCAPVDGSR